MTGTTPMPPASPQPSSGTAAPPSVAAPPARIAPPAFYPPPPTGSTHRWFFLHWPRTLRWRLTFTYVGLLVCVLVALAIALNLILGHVIFSTDWDSLYNEARSGVATNQRTFDSLVRGAALGDHSCVGVLSYQDAFNDAIAQPLIGSHAGVQSVYLLDLSGQIIAPLSDGTSDSAAPPQAPYLRAGPIYQLAAQTRATPRTSGTGYVTDTRYLDTDATGQRIGVILIVDRYATASHCVAPTAPTATGIVEVITTFPRYDIIMRRMRALMLLALFGVLLVGGLVGGPLTAAALRPLSRMTRTARRIAEGDLSQRVRLPHTGDEISQLAGTFDEMIERIDQAFRAQVTSEARMRQFVADASHELRTPLTAILSGIEVLQRGAKDDPVTEDRVLRTTQHEAERMSRLITDLLTLARLDAGRPLDRMPLDLVGLAGEAVDQARLVAGDRQVLLDTDHGGRLLVTADSDRLKQVLLILLDNALQYGRQGPDGWVRLFIGRGDRDVVVRVSDNGPGIPSADLPHIFDRFYRAERAQARRLQSRLPADPTAASTPSSPSGSGLGLAIAHAIIRAHGGAIMVVSAPATGTTFTINLPQTTTETPTAATPPA